jgi:squalene-hopene/tetraprenyl-beta-curcumene cyclase
MNALALLVCASAALVPPAANRPTPQHADPRPLTSGRLGDEIDRSLHWLRGRQDAETGGYGGVADTALVLVAFAGSPRGYTASDGPFVARAARHLVSAQAPDGAIADAGAEDEAVRKAQTVTAKTALDMVGGEGAAEASARAGAFLGIGDVVLADDASRFEEMDTDPLLDVAAQLLEERGPEPYWETEPDAVRATAGRVRELNQIARVLASRRPPAAPKDARPLPPFSPADRDHALAAMRRGADFLLAQSQDGGWGFEGRADPGITAMVAGALLALPAPRPANVQAAIDRALDWLVTLQKPDGSIHAGQLASYVTSASVLALSKAGRETDRQVIAKARAWLQALQADEGEGYAPGDRYYGGVGYGGDERPDLSNLQMALDALVASGLEEDSDTFRKALVFLQRVQNRSESNDVEVRAGGVTVESGNDGGGVYAPGESKAGFVELADGTKVPRSYGSMSYALLRGFLFAGLDTDDARVQAVWKWLREHYTLDVNPGFEASGDPSAAYQGLFYYFYTMAHALDLFGEERVVDAAGAAHDWRAELVGRLAAMQRQDGSWVNENASRWYEGNPVLATAYALLTLRAALPAGEAGGGPR